MADTILATGATLVALDTLYQVDITVEIGGAVMVASYHVDFATEDWPEITPLDPQAALYLCR